MAICRCVDSHHFQKGKGSGNVHPKVREYRKIIYEIFQSRKKLGLCVNNFRASIQTLVGFRFLVKKLSQHV